MNKKVIALLTSAVLLALPIASFADTAPMSTPSQPACINLTMNLKMSPSVDPAVKLQILNLQLALVSEGFTVDPTESGNFGQSTKTAVKAFQEKYRDDVLAPWGYKKGTGNVGTLTRLKLQALYGCRVNAATFPGAGYTGPVSLSVANLALDGNGVTATFCNNGSKDLPTAPFRIRLNGINRDFEEIGAQKAGACTTDTWEYATWGLSYDPGVTFSAVGLIDPNGIYKIGQLQFPTSGTATITVPALPGFHLSVRGVGLKSTGVQATLCNLGTKDLTSFPIAIKVDGTSKNFDVPEAYIAGKCVTKNWTYDNFGVTYVVGSSHIVTLTVDPANTYNELNEFDNVATSIGTP